MTVHRGCTKLLCLALTLALPAALHAEEAAAPALTLSEAERGALLAMLEEGRTRTEELVARVEDDDFGRRPEPDRWSVSEVLEHIAATEGLLFGLVENALAAEPDPEWQQVAEAVPIDAFTTRVRDRSQRAQAPEILQPKGAQTREEGLERYRTNRAATIEFVRSTAAPLKQHTAEIPGGKLTVHHFLNLIAAHNLRHNEQIAEALEQLESP